MLNFFELTRKRRLNLSDDPAKEIYFSQLGKTDLTIFCQAPAMVFQQIMNTCLSINRGSIDIGSYMSAHVN